MPSGTFYDIQGRHILKKKIITVIIDSVGIVMVILCALLFLQMFLMNREIIRSSQEAGEVIEGLSETAMRDQAQDFLRESSVVRARVSDDSISKFRDSVQMIAAAAEHIYTHSKGYGSVILDEYDESNMGELVTYVAYGDGVDPEDAAIKKEVALMNNLQSILHSINESNESMASDYYASESGLFFCAEAASEYNIPVNGAPLSFEARQRPWYTEASGQGEVVFTGVIEDADTGESVITCGAPVYVDGKLKGVAGAGLFLDTIRKDVDSFHIGENGFACVINNYGQILFSGSGDTELAAMINFDVDLRNSSNTEIAELTKDALNGGADVRLVEVSGTKYYVAYAPMETVSWSYFTVLPESEVIAPSEALLKELDASNQNQIEFVKKSIISSVRFLVLFMFLVGAVMYFIATKFAGRLARPITLLTDKVRNVKGDNLDFEWDMDTDDEVQVLAGAFGSMTDRMKQYIDDIVQITADRERIGAELSVATQIQADMLPRIFPPFPEKKEFELFALMDPAKEVGGDFYDFFLVDDDHLCMVMADVSGKGVPAALFMVIAKTLIKNRATMGGSPAEILEYTNDQLCEGNEAELFVTVWIAVLEISTGKGIAANAGHEHPVIRRADGDYELVTYKHSAAVATFPGIPYREHEFELHPGDSLFVYTDGVPEATNTEDELYGTERMLEVLNSNKDSSVEDTLNALKSSIDEFASGAPQFDDITMLILKYLG